MHRVTLVPNFNKVSALREGDDQAILGEPLDMSDLRAEGVHAVHFYPDTGTVEVEYVKPANETMTVDQFHDYFGEATRQPRKKARRHLDEALANVEEAAAKELD